MTVPGFRKDVKPGIGQGSQCLHTKTKWHAIGVYHFFRQYVFSRDCVTLRDREQKSLVFYIDVCNITKLNGLV